MGKNPKNLTQHKSDHKRYSSVKNIPGRYPELAWSEATFRWLIFNADSNGFRRCLIKIGSRVAIDLDHFEQWMEIHRGSE